MLREGLEWFKKNIHNKEWFVLDEGRHANKTVVLNRVTGETKEIANDPDNTRIEAFSLDAFAALVMSHTDDVQGKVFINSGGIVAVLDAVEEYPRDFIWMDLHEHLAVKKLVNGVTASPKDVARWVDVELNNCVCTPEGFSDSLRDVKFHNSESKMVRADHGDEGLSMEVKKQVSGVSDIGPRLTASFQMYPHLGTDFADTIGIVNEVRIDVDQGVIEVRALPGQVERHRQFVANSLVKDVASRLATINKKHPPVYAGKWTAFRH